MKKQPLGNILQSQGFGTRRWCRELIEEGEVTVGGEVVNDFRTEFDTQSLRFTVYGEEWLFREHIYLCLNKPSNYECSRKPSAHPGVLTLLPEQFARRDIQPVGRLDHDTTGMLLMSDDGAFIHAQSSPKRHVPKVYIATTDEPVTAALVTALKAGVQLHDEPAPLAARRCEIAGSHEIEIVLEQGKYHQVKRMLAAAGSHCAALRRIAIGTLTLASLALEEGEWCYLDEAALQKLAGE
jgi:16S rRNA pseudouridine516 synthase